MFCDVKAINFVSTLSHLRLHSYDFILISYFVCVYPGRDTVDPPGGNNIKGARTWGPSTYHQRERGALTEFPVEQQSASGQASFSKSAPNLDKSKSQPPPLPPAAGSLSPLPPRMQRGGGFSSMHNRQWLEGRGGGSRVVGTGSSLGKSHDEGLNRIRGKKLSSSQFYQRGHTTNLCGSSGSGSPFKITLRDNAGFNPSGSLVLRRVQDSSSSVASSGMNAPERDGVGCFGLIRGSSGDDKPTKSIENVTGSPMIDIRRQKKFSLDNVDRNLGSAGGGFGHGGGDGNRVAEETPYDIAFYKKMQQSVDELFDGRRFPRSPPPHNMFNSKSSGDLVNSDSESFSGSHDSSEFRRECFFNKSAPEHDSSSSSLPLKAKSRSGSLPKSGGGDKFQYLSLNDLLENNHKTSPDSSAQYSNSSTSSHTTVSSSSRKNSQVSFEGKSMPQAGSSVKLPPMKSEVSPRKFDKIYNMGAAVPVTTKNVPQKRNKAGFITNLFKKGHRSVEKRTAKQREGRDERIKLVADNDDHHREEEGVMMMTATDSGSTSRHVVVGAVGLGSRSADTYDMIYTKRHIIAKQNVVPADHSLFRSDSP